MRVHSARTFVLGSLVTIFVRATTALSPVVVEDYNSFCGCIVLRSLGNTTNAEEARRLLETIPLSSLDRSQCDAWNRFPDYEITVYADRYGNPTQNLSQGVGVYANDIYSFCNTQDVKGKLSLSDFTSATTALLLPYIALFSQLGLQTGSRRGDILSLLVSLGSPMWTCSSIGITMLCRRAIRKRFNRLRAVQVSCPRGEMFLKERRTSFAQQRVQSKSDLSGWAFLTARFDAAQIVLQSFSQAPVRLNTRPGFVESLITSPRNQAWWVAASKKLRDRERKLDHTYITQSVIAIIAWLLAIVSDFNSLPGRTATSDSAEWQICYGTLWLWVFPSTYGPIAVKSQSKAGNLSSALLSPSSGDLLVSYTLGNGETVLQLEQTAIRQRSGLAPMSQHNDHVEGRRPSTSQRDLQNEDEMAFRALQIPDCYGFSTYGDEEGEGPNSFINRSFASWWTCEQVLIGFETFHCQLKEADRESYNVMEGRSRAVIETDTETELIEMDITDIDRDEVTQTTAESDSGLQERSEPSQPESRQPLIDVGALTAYPRWSQISWDQWRRFVLGNLFGLLIQWGTTGPAIYLMYFSPPVGLGCLSGSLLLYAVCATLSWFFQLVSMLFSHAAMLHYQRYHIENPRQRLDQINPGLLGHHWGTRRLSFLRGAAVITRVVGKSIAITNAFWIIIFSLLTYTNVMETPYCTTAYFGLHARGWMRLWNFDPHQFDVTKIQELGSLVLGSTVAYIACVLIFAMTYNGKKDWYRWSIVAGMVFGYAALVIHLTQYGVKSIQK